LLSFSAITDGNGELDDGVIHDRYVFSW